jgi:carbon starvation protein
MAICAKKGAFRFLWIPALPLAFAAVVTITASFLKIFSPVPAIGYWAQHTAFKDALAAGEQSFGNAQTVPAMEAVVRNTFIQGTLSIVFVSLAIIVIITAILATVRAFRNGGGVETEDAAVASRTYAPAGLIATPAEKELESQWNALGADKRPARSGH